MKRDHGHDARAIANRILDIRAENGDPLTIMQLIKLIYISDGWSLALLGKPLVREMPEAWQYGPVYRSVYNEFSGIGARPVEARARIRGTDLPIEERLSPDEEAVLRMVVRSYGKMSAYALSSLTHQSGTPWSTAFEVGPYTPIDTAEMKRHFEGLKDKRLVRQSA
ncbi:Panacea domain-containing protein [Sphingomonas sp. Tas61C01]|uniref:Panacea domain-containing protein n=1 Tax=Sphingomonas sp. Tas61C01 TaxID=3458297 RepID=UPI00403E492D